MSNQNLEVQAILEHLIARNETLSVAESLTGGSLAAALTAVPGASRAFLGGTISYNSDVKINHLGVSSQLIASHGVVSAAVAEAMAQGARESFGSTWALATTGVAGPGESDGVAAGTVWIAVAGPVIHSALLVIEGGREVVRNMTVSSAIAAFERILGTRK